VNVDLIKSAFAVMVTGRLHHHPACRNTTRALLELGDMLGDGILDLLSRVHVLKLDLRRRLHVWFPIGEC